MEIVSRRESGAVVVSLDGRLDALTTPQYEHLVNELLAAGETRYVVDLASLEYVSSAGLRAFLVTAKQLKACRGHLRFANVLGTVREVFTISGFGAIFHLDESVSGALDALARSPS